MKRLVDIVVSALLLVVLSPALAAIAIAVKASSRGPVLFRQERVGLHGRVFRIRKFRSMGAGPVGPMVTVSSDPRITRVGHFLRGWKLDELPQLLDVLEGTMSLVGPRPEVPEYVAMWPHNLRPLILSVRPGITDPTSVDLRNESKLLASVEDPERYYVTELLPRKATSYAEYVRHHSLTADLWVVLRTVRATMAGRGQRPTTNDQEADTR